jgi:hypothetical protein
MRELDFAVEPEVECPNDDGFIWATTTTGGEDAVEEYVACKMYPLAAGFGFKSVPIGMTHVSKIETCLSLFAVGTIAAEHTDHFLVEVETDAEWVLWSFGPREYDALAVENILIGGHLNWVFKHMGVPYAPHPPPGSKASQAANKKRKAELCTREWSRARAKQWQGHGVQRFLCRWFVHASASGPGWYSASFLGATASADTQRHRTIVKIILGCWLLRWSFLGEFVCKALRAAW